MTPDPPQERRDQPDRRQSDLPFWHPRRLRGRRLRNRRSHEHDRPYTVDRVPGWTFALAVLLLALTLTDGLLTLALLDLGCEEANPILRFLLARGAPAFLAGKYVLTAAFLHVALVLNQYPLFGSRLRVGQLLPVVLGLYLALIVYQVGLWSWLR